MFSPFFSQNVMKTLVTLLPHEPAYTDATLVFACLIYFLESLIYIMMALISSLQLRPVFEIEKRYSIICIAIIIIVRITLSAVYVLLNKRHILFYLSLKTFQIVCLFLISNDYVNITIIFEIIADFVYIICKSQRRINFDSRLDYQCYIYKICMEKVALFLFNFESYSSRISETFIFMVVCVIVAYCSWKDTIYSARTKNIIALLSASTAAFLISLFILFLVDQSREMHLINYVMPIMLFIIIFAWMWKKDLINYEDSELLKLEFEILSIEDKENYVMQGIRNVEILKNQQQILNILISHNAKCKNPQCCLILDSEREKLMKSGSIIEFFRSHFQSYLMKLLFKNYHCSTKLKNILLYYYSKKSAQKLMRSLELKDFWCHREYTEIKSEIVDEDIGSKIKTIEANEIKIKQTSELYITKLCKFIDFLLKDSINLGKCEKLGQELLEIQATTMKYYVKGDGVHKKNKISKQETQKKKAIPLSNDSIKILKILNRQVFPEDLIVEECSNNQEFLKFINSESPLLIISAELDSVGTIIGLNKAACRLTGYLESQIVGKNLNILIHESMQKHHDKILFDRCSKIDDESARQIHTFTFIIKKTKYVCSCKLRIKFINGTVGRRWLVWLQDVTVNLGLLVCNEESEIIGMSEKSSQLQMGLCRMGKKIGVELLKNIESSNVLCTKLPFQEADQKTYLSWTLLNGKNKLQNFPHFSMINIKYPSNNQHSLKNTLTRVVKSSVEEEKKKVMKNFSFEYDEKKSIFTNVKVSKEQFQQFPIKDEHLLAGNERVAKIYGEDINELVYINGQLEFRENKRLEEEYECKIHPLHAKMIAEDDNNSQKQIKISNQAGMNELLEKENLKKPKQFLCLIGLLIAFVLIIVSFGGIIGYSIKRSNLIQVNKQSISSYICLRIFYYNKLIFMTNYPVLNALNISSITEKRTASNLITAFEKIEKISRIIAEIDIIETKWEHFKFQKIFPAIRENDTYLDIIETFQIQLQKLNETLTEQDYIKYSLDALRTITNELVPINLYIKNEIQAYYSEKTEAISKQINLFMIICIIASLIIGLIAAIILRSVILEHQSRMEMFLYFEDSYLENFALNLEDLRKKIRLDLDLISNRSFEDDLLLENEALMHKKKIIGNQKWAQFRCQFLLPLVFFIGMFFLFFQMMNIPFQRSLSITEIEQFRRSYSRQILDLNLIWQQKLISRAFESDDQIKQAFNGTINLINESESVQIYQTSLYNNFNLIHNHFYTEQFMAEYKKNIISPFCYSLFSLNYTGECNPSINGYYSQSIDHFIIMKNVNVLRNFDKYYPTRGENTDFLNSNQAILEANKYEEFIMEMNNKMLISEINRQSESASFILIIVVLCYLLPLLLTSLIYIRLAFKVKEYLFLPIKILCKVFPLFVLNNNQIFLSWVQSRNFDQLLK